MSARLSIWYFFPWLSADSAFRVAAVGSRRSPAVARSYILLRQSDYNWRSGSDAFAKSTDVKTGVINKMKRFLIIAICLLSLASEVGAQQFPLMDMVANKVINKYQTSSCAQLMAQRDQPRSAQEQNAIQVLRDDPQMRR